MALPKAYARWRASRLGRITDALERRVILDLAALRPGQRALDVGCGDGELALSLAQAGAATAAVDADARMLAAARCRLEAANAAVRLCAADARALPFADGSFDLVTAITVLCFVGEPRRAVAEMARVLKPGGRLVLGELNRRSLWAAWRRVRGRLGHPVWRAAHFMTADELARLLAAAGLRVETRRAAAFYPPAGWAAAAMAPIDGWLGRRWLAGAAFLAHAAIRQGAGGTGRGDEAP